MVTPVGIVPVTLLTGILLFPEPREVHPKSSFTTSWSHIFLKKINFSLKFSFMPFQEDSHMVVYLFIDQPDGVFVLCTLKRCNTVPHFCSDYHYYPSLLCIFVPETNTFSDNQLFSNEFPPGEPLYEVQLFSKSQTFFGLHGFFLQLTSLRFLKILKYFICRFCP